MTKPNNPNPAINTTSDATTGEGAANDQGGEMIASPNARDRAKERAVTRVRKHRREEALILLAWGLRAENPGWDDDRIQAQALKDWTELKHSHVGLSTTVDRLKNSCPAAPRSARDPEIEEAAVLRLDLFQWATDFLMRLTAGRAPKRGLIVAMFFRMVAQKGKPEILSTFRHLSIRTMKRDFVYGKVQGPKLSSAYNSMNSMLTSKWPAMWRYINLDMYRQIIEERDAKGRLKHPNAGVYLAVDGTEIEAHLPQRPGKGRGKYGVHIPELEDFLRRGTMATFNRDGQRGYKLMLLCDAVLGLPLMWKLYPNTVDEREACIDLLERFFKLYPDSPARYILGDRLYDESVEFARELEFDWGLHPVFKRKGTYGKVHRWTAGHPTHKGVDGVPICGCGELMAYKDTSGFHDGKRRVREQQEARAEGREPAPWATRGVRAPNDAQIRWKCQHGVCPGVVTMPWTEPRIYTFLPREGTSKRRTLREALYIKRNAVEGIFSQVKGSGVGGDDQWRAFWAKDFETEHLLGARLAYLTATRLISSNGLYDEVAAEADSWGWPDGRFGEGPVDLHTDEHETRLACRTAQEPRPPASWIRDRGESGYSHEHLQLSRARRRKEQGCHDIAVAA